MPSSIVIIGAGEIGRALGKVLVSNGHSVVYWDKTPVPNQKPLSEILPAAHVVFFCTPSWAVRSAVLACKKFLTKKTVVVCLSKGLEKKTGKSMDQVLGETLPDQPFALLLGPLLAEELELQRMGVAAVATSSRSTFDLLSRAFLGSSIRCEWVRDVRSAALLSVLKNIYAVGLGIADGLEWGFNAKGWAAAQMLREMDLILPRASRGGAVGTTGAGDFIATAFSPYSKNREYGHVLVKTGVCDLGSEGCVSLPLVWKRVSTKAKTLPFLSAMYAILYKKADAKRTFEAVLP